MITLTTHELLQLLPFIDEEDNDYDDNDYPMHILVLSDLAN